jgi:hypothetical protein
VSGEAFGEDAGLGPVEPAELDLGAPVEGAQPGEQSRQGVVGVGLGQPRRRDHEQRRVGCGAQDVMQQLHGLLVGGVQVVGDQHERTGSGEERLDDGVE